MLISVLGPKAILNRSVLNFALMYGRPKRRRQAQRLVWLAGAILSAAGTCVAVPAIGIPLSVGVTAYIAAKSCGPHMLLRGRILSPWQHHRAAMIMGTLALTAAALGSTAVYALDLAAALEAGLQSRLDLADSTGELKAGEVLVECRVLACARARIVQTARRDRLGVAALSGFTLHSEEVFGWSRPDYAPASAISETRD